MTIFQWLMQNQNGAAVLPINQPNSKLDIQLNVPHLMALSLLIN
jgi:hypothetical protein